MRIYLASSWRNEWQPSMVEVMRDLGHEVYDFRNPEPGKVGFSWKDAGPVDVPERYMITLGSKIATDGFELDLGAMEWADTFVLLLPCGRSAHLEAGWAAGKGKNVHVVLNEQGFEPELMYRLCSSIHLSPDHFIQWLRFKRS